MSGGKSKLQKAQGEYQNLQGGPGMAPGAGGHVVSDEKLDSKRHDRGYNPVDDAERGSVSGKLNEDSGRYRKGPGPM